MGFELVVDILYLCRTEDCCVNQKQLLECKVVVILICMYICIHTGFDRNDLYDPITKYVLWMLNYVRPGQRICTRQTMVNKEFGTEW